MDKNFIVTNDRETADKLVEAGFQMVQFTESSWTFLNDNTKFMFADNECLKFAYTNKIMF